MKKVLCLLGLALILLSAGCVLQIPGLPGFDYNAPDTSTPPGNETTLQLIALPTSVDSGESLTIYADYSAGGQLIEGATCLLKVGDIRTGMTYSSQGYGGTVDTGGIPKGSQFVGVTCSKPGYQQKEGGISFSIQ